MPEALCRGTAHRQSSHPRPQSTPASADELAAGLERLRAGNRLLKQALASHAVVDQAIGVLTVLGQITPGDGFMVLREVSLYAFDAKALPALGRAALQVKVWVCQYHRHG